jgi:hypothetical protein
MDHRSKIIPKSIIKKPTKYCFIKGGNWEGGYGNIIEGVNLFEIHYRHIWNFHMKLPCTINES